MILAKQKERLFKNVVAQFIGRLCLVSQAATKFGGEGLQKGLKLNCLKEERRRKEMCVPISVVMGGVVNSCTGICRVWPQVTGLVALVGVLVWNFRKSIFKKPST